MASADRDDAGGEAAEGGEGGESEEEEDGTAAAGSEHTGSGIPPGTHALA